MIAALALFLAEPAAAEPEIEEIIVYDDGFARWDNTRWLVTSELILPLPLELGADNNAQFWTYATQARLVLTCDKDGKLSKKTIEVMCTIDDIGLLATSIRRYERKKDLEVVERVLAEIDAKLTGAKIQIQTNLKGGVTNVDLEGVNSANQRQRELNENLRQLLLRVMAGFHLKLPDHAQRAGQYYEYNSALMNLPSITAARGSNTLVHTVSRHDGYQLVQTLGQGTTTTKLPNFNLRSASFSDGASLGPAEATEATLDSPTIADPNGGGRERDVDVTYALEHTGVAVVERATGIMTERVWVTRGTPTASSAGGTLNNPFRNVGRVALLGDNDQPDVGPTGQVAWPLQKMEHLIPWVDIDVTPGR